MIVKYIYITGLDKKQNTFSTDIKETTQKAEENKFLIKLCMQRKIFH